MLPPPASDSPRSALRQGVLVLGAVAALFTALSTSLESQRRGTSPSDSSTPSASRTASVTETCAER